MARLKLLVGMALAASLLTACTSGDTATTSSSTTSSSSTAAAPSAADSRGSGVSSGASDSLAPADLDDATITWFSTLCGDLTDLQTSSEAVGASLSSETAAPAEQQAAVVTAVKQIGTTFKETATSLGKVPAPTIDQGEKVAGNVIQAFDGVGDALLSAGLTFDAATITDQASLTSASQTLSTSLQTSFGTIGSSLAGLSQAVTPDIKAAVEAIPGCEVLGS